MARQKAYTVFSYADDSAQVFFNADDTATCRVTVPVPGVKHDPENQEQLQGEHRRIAVDLARQAASKFIEFSGSH